MKQQNVNYAPTLNPMINDFQAITAFILELEKLKNVERRIKPLGLQRYENSAEHSWQVAFMAMSLGNYACEPVDMHKVICMLLLHDVVEIDTGDKFAYSSDHDDYANEHAAAQRIFGLLPEDIGKRFVGLWEEFEAAKCPEAKFAKGIDRLMPVLQNLNNHCQSWLDHKVSISQILNKNKGVALINPQLWDWVTEQVIEKGRAVGLAE